MSKFKPGDVVELRTGCGAGQPRAGVRYPVLGVETEVEPDIEGDWLRLDGIPNMVWDANLFVLAYPEETWEKRAVPFTLGDR